MARQTRFSTKRLPDSVRSRLEVSSALAWEALVETHATQAAAFVQLLSDRVPLEETLPRYILELDLSESMAAAVRTRVIVALETPPESEAPAQPGGTIELRTPGAAEEAPAQEESDESGWRRFRPDVVVREFRERQKRDDITEGLIKLALARAEEAVIATHVDNAITFAALLEGYLPIDRAVQEYLEAVTLSGGRAQAVHQRTMARLADVHLPIPQPQQQT
jgi:hypothetical protein